MGETFQAILADQFGRLRDGDRFWFEGDEYLKALASGIGEDLNNRTLSDIIQDNSLISGIQDNVFIAAEPMGY